MSHVNQSRLRVLKTGGTPVKVILTIQRLTLREFISSDAALMYELNNDPEVIKFTGDQPYDSLEQGSIAGGQQ